MADSKSGRERDSKREREKERETERDRERERGRGDVEDENEYTKKNEESIAICAHFVEVLSFQLFRID